ncbi:MAG: hypothetical protein JJ872_15960 [Marivivens sp.]|nr:hypothetical protein [Marivivens sp.]
MKRSLSAVAALALLGACNGTQPFFDGENAPWINAPDEGSFAEELPPAEEAPTPTGRIQRYEARDGNGGGYARDIRYNSSDDTFYVNNLAFDGENTYQRGTNVPSLADGEFNVYDAEITVADYLTGDTIRQIVPYRAIYAESTNTALDDDGNVVPRSRFAIVRTGGYSDFGFGGFVYMRDGGVSLPPENTTGQAGFEGKYAGIRIFNGVSGLEFTEADVEIAIDFDDFDANNTVRGLLYNRTVYDANGAAVPLGNYYESPDDQLPYPDLPFVIREGVDNFNEDGEMFGLVENSRYDPYSLKTVVYETGEYYAVMAGDLNDPADGGEIVGIIVIDSVDPRTDKPAQETGGFIVYR